MIDQSIDQDSNDQFSIDRSVLMINRPTDRSVLMINRPIDRFLVPDAKCRADTRPGPFSVSSKTTHVYRCSTIRTIFRPVPNEKFIKKSIKNFRQLLSPFLIGPFPKLRSIADFFLRFQIFLISPVFPPV